MTTINTEVTTVKPSQLKVLLAAAIPAQLPVLVTGPPGCGKTEIMAQAAAAAGANLVLKHPAIDDPTDYKGMPWVDKGAANFLPFGDLHELISAKKPTVCFFDDLGQATEQVQSAVMQLLLARKLNGHKISDQVTFVAATNRRGDKANVRGILEPVKSRFATIVELAVDVNEWCAWALSNGVQHELVAFIRFRPELLAAFKATADMTNSPSPRTWAFLSKWLALGLPNGLQVPTFEGSVGRGAAIEFVAFLRIWQQMVSPDLILTNPDSADIPKEPSALFAVGGALASKVTPTNMGRYCRYLERMIDADYGEFAAASMKSATARDKKLTNTQGYIKAMSGSLGELMLS